ncbi:MAG: hypothetical protein MJ189_01285 [Coriobacteriales bacterium]|nr:hypothetical protein [Coriobacteriales bacterium]
MQIKNVALIGAGAVGAYFIYGFSGLENLSFCVVAEGESAEKIKTDGVIINEKTYHPVIKTPEEAKAIIEKQRQAEGISEPKNLEEQALSLVGRDIYEKLIKEYTQKQWGRECKDLPSFIIKRLPVRFIYDNNYFNDIYQGIPIGGYTQIFEKLLDVDGIDVKLGTSFDEIVAGASFKDIADKLIYTGAIDEYFNFKLGKLDYRTVKFETEVLEGVENYQGNAVVNFTSADVPYTRIIEHKHFEFAKDVHGNSIKDTIISKEYSKEFEEGDEPYYPVNDDRNSQLFKSYEDLAKQENDVIFAGRLGAYKYYDMAPCIEAAFELVKQEIGVECI